MDETDHSLTPRIHGFGSEQENQSNQRSTHTTPRQCWVCVPPVIALKTSGPQLPPRDWQPLVRKGLDLRQGVLDIPRGESHSIGLHPRLSNGVLGARLSLGSAVQEAAK
jgi:hypothetical protein